MSNITAYPLQDGFETTLAQSWNGAVGTVYLNTAPSFTFPSGVKTYIVVNPGKTNMQVGEIDSLNVGLKTVNVSSISVGSGAGTTYTQESHSVGSTVIISDNYQFWKNIIDAVNTKIDGTTQGIYFYADATARDAALGATPSTNGLIVGLTSEGKLTYSLGGAWIDVGTGATFVNASTTAAGKVEIATTGESQAGTDTGGTGALLSVLPSDIAKNTQSSTFIYGADVGGDDAYVVALTPVLAAYTTGQTLQFKPTTANTGACTVNFGPSVLNIKTKDGNDPQSGVIRAGMVVTGQYDGTNFVLDAEDFATDTNKGITEYATPAEVLAGTSTSLAVTPEGAKAIALPRNQIVTATLTWDDVAQSQIVISHALGIAPTRISLIDYGSGFDAETMIGERANNNGTITSLAVYRDTGDNRLTTANQTLVTYTDTGSNTGDWRVTSVSSTQVLLDYTIVADGGSRAPTSNVCYFMLSY